jgi:hypothetical protein
MLRIRLWTMMTCPPRAISRWIALAMIDSFHLVTIVSIGFLSRGGVVRSDICLSPERARLSDRGIGVADSMRISIPDFIFLIFSLCVTQNLCSSSITRSQSLRNLISSERSLCVPTTTSISPEASLAIVAVFSLALFIRVMMPIRTQKAPSRSRNVS